MHRFYAGKKATGVLYLFTFGGVGVGWIVDIILVATGMLPDKAGHIIQSPGHRKKESKIRFQSPDVCEELQDSDKLQKTVENVIENSTEVDF